MNGDKINFGDYYELTEGLILGVLGLLSQRLT